MDADMTDSTTMTVRLRKETREQLEELAKSTKRSRSFLAAEAIEEFVRANAWQVELIEKRLARAKAGGPSVPHEEVDRWLASWGSDDELPKPRT